jgi:hypothetical protein
MPKRVLDKFDIEAEREGFFVAKHNATICKPFGQGKIILRQRKMHKDGDKRIECKTIKQSYTRAF